MKNVKFLWDILTKSLKGLFIGVTLLMSSYVLVYLVAGEELFLKEIVQINNFETLIIQLVTTALAYYFITIYFYLSVYIDEKYKTGESIKQHPYIYISFFIMGIVFYIVIAKILSNTNVYSQNISDMNVIVSVIVFLLVTGIYFIKNIQSKKIIREINKIIEKNKQE